MINYLNLESLAEDLNDLRKFDDLTDEELAQLHELTTIEDELGGDLYDYARKISPTLIPSKDFEKHVREVAMSSGAAVNWNQVDWEHKADLAKDDHVEISYMNNKYLIRG